MRNENVPELSKAELLTVIKELSDRLDQYENSRDENRWLEDALKRRTRDLSERLKEFQCLSRLLELSATGTNPFPLKAEEILRFIQSGWQLPEITCVRIKLRDQIYQTANFKKANGVVRQPISVRKKTIGTLEVGSIEADKKDRGWPFLKEEHNLIEAISNWISSIDS